MSRTLLRLLVVAVLLCGATGAFARLNGPPRGVTGAWSVGGKASEVNCQYCHDPSQQPLNDPSGQLEILDLPEQFDISTDYPVRVRLAHTWSPLPVDSLHWGFQMTAVRSDSGTGYGTFIPSPGNQIATTSAIPFDPSRKYIEHNASGAHTGDLGPVEWNFIWHSPDYPAGKVYFFAAGNSANGDFLSSHDWIFTAADSMTFVNAAVTELIRDRTVFSRPWPNPSHGRTELHFSIAKPGIVELSLYDLTGRRIRTLTYGVRAAGRGSAVWDGRNDAGVRVPNGLYFARLAAPGALPAVHKITLMR